MKVFIIILILLSSASSYSVDSRYKLCEIKKDSNLFNDSYEVSSDYSEITKKNYFQMSGNVLLESNNLNLSSESLLLDKESNFFEAEKAKFLIKNSNIRGSAQKFSKTSEQIDVNNSNVTFCPNGNNNWSIDSSKLKIDLTSNKASAENVKFNLLGVPIFYLPYIDFYTSGRGSGFLPPKISLYKELSLNNESSSRVTIPYYFNLNADKDLILSVDYLSSRGNVLQANYRGLSYFNNQNNGSLELSTKLLNDDKITNNKRWSIEAAMKQNFFDKYFLDISLNRFSDKNFGNEINLEGTDTDRLLSNLQISKLDKNGNTFLATESEQIINNGVSDYIRELAIGHKNKISRNDLDFLYDVELIKFSHNDSSKRSGSRSFLSSEFSNAIYYDSILVKPKLSLSQTNYFLKDENNHSRLSYEMSIDASTELERDIKISNKKYLQTLSPKFKYTFVPIKNQNNIPNFDTESIENSLLGPFSELNYFTGKDKISNKNLIMYGFESSILDINSMDSLFTFGVSQNIHLTKTKTDINGNQTPIERFDDLDLKLNFSNNNFDFTNQIKIDKKFSNTKYSFSQINFTKDNNIFSLAHYLDMDEGINFSTKIPSINKFDFFGSLSKNLSSSRIDKNVFGLTYNDCCLSGTLGLVKKYAGDGKYNRKVNFDIVLKGLSEPGPSIRYSDTVPDLVKEF